MEVPFLKESALSCRIALFLSLSLLPYFFPLQYPSHFSTTYSGIHPFSNCRSCCVAYPFRVIHTLNMKPYNLRALIPDQQLCAVTPGSTERLGMQISGLLVCDFFSPFDEILAAIITKNNNHNETTRLVQMRRKKYQ